MGITGSDCDRASSNAVDSSEHRAGGRSQPGSDDVSRDNRHPTTSGNLREYGSTIIAGFNGLRPLLTRDEDLNLLASSLEESRATTEQATETREGLSHEPQPEDAEETTAILEEEQERTAALPPTITVAELPATEVVGELPPAIEAASAETLSVDEIELAITLIESLPEKSDQALADPLETTSTPAIPDVLSAQALAQRLQVSPMTINRNKYRADFAKWSNRHDPDGIAWCYLKKSKEFVPIRQPTPKQRHLHRQGLVNRSSHCRFPTQSSD